jgi:hypothetical protein
MRGLLQRIVKLAFWHSGARQKPVGSPASITIYTSSCKSQRKKKVA